jgi:hypothetical protein
MVVPLLVGLSSLAAYNRALTGDAWTTPYQLYNQIYTPSHSYGYHNVARGRTAAGPNVDRDYNDWAIDLTLAESLKNCRQRLLQSWAWTIGILPIGIAVAVVVILRRQFDTFFWLFPASVLTLHAAYLPYWFVGLFDFHYVFESTAAWALVAGIAGDSLLRFGTMTGRRLVPGWLMLVAVAAVSRNLISLDVTGPSLLSAGIRQIEPMRIRHALFLRLVEENVQERPAVVYVPDPPIDLHVDFVINDPDLDGDVLFARLRNPAELEIPFRGRAKYLLDERRWTISRYSPSQLNQPAGEGPNQAGTHQ